MKIKMNFFDLYYMVIWELYGFPCALHRVYALMSMSLVFNFLSIALLTYPAILDRFEFWIGYAALGIVLLIIIDIVYTKKRRELIAEAYEWIGQDARQSSRAWVAVYEIATIILLIIAVSSAV